MPRKFAEEIAMSGICPNCGNEGIVDNDSGLCEHCVKIIKEENEVFDEKEEDEDD